MAKKNDWEIELEVHQVLNDDVHKDVVRIPEKYRKDVDAKPISSGEICKITVGEISTYAVIRGEEGQNGKIIRIDEDKRKDLLLKLNARTAFRINKASIWGKLVWALRSSDPGYRISMEIALISLVTSLVMGAYGICLSLEAKAEMRDVAAKAQRSAIFALQTTITDIRLATPSGGAEGLRMISQDDKEKMSERILTLLKSQENNLALQNDEKCAGRWSAFRDYMILLSMPAADEMLVNNYYLKLSEMTEACSG